jgi:hypothetical protein
VSVAGYLGFAVSAALLTSCGTPEQNAWGIPRDDVREIGRLVRAQTSDRIGGYDHDKNDPSVINVWVDAPVPRPILYQAHRVRGQWKIEPRVIVY